MNTISTRLPLTKPNGVDLINLKVCPPQNIKSLIPLDINGPVLHGLHVGASVVGSSVVGSSVGSSSVGSSVISSVGDDVVHITLPQTLMLGRSTVGHPLQLVGQGKHCRLIVSLQSNNVRITASILQGLEPQRSRMQLFEIIPGANGDVGSSVGSSVVGSSVDGEVNTFI